MHKNREQDELNPALYVLHIYARKQIWVASEGSLKEFENFEAHKQVFTHG